MSIPSNLVSGVVTLMTLAALFVFHVIIVLGIIAGAGWTMYLWLGIAAVFDALAVSLYVRWLRDDYGRFR